MTSCASQFLGGIKPYLMKSLITEKLRYTRQIVAKIFRVVVAIRKNPTSVLILTQDLFERIGGGESVYRGLISDNPEIDFFFFAKSKIILQSNLLHEYTSNVINLDGSSE